MNVQNKRMGISRKIFCVVAAVVLFATALCACHEQTETPITVDDTSFSAYEFSQQTPTDVKVTYERLNMANEYMQRYGIYGDGCQWEVSFECSKTGDLMLYGVDVAGMYRSLDHGKTWETCNNGILNRGVGMFAIDPVNSKHVLAAGLGNRNTKGYGMWRSDDMCETWNATQQLSIGGERYIWDGLEFDPTSSDGSICTDVYYSAPYMRDRTLRMNAYDLPALYGQMDKAKAGLYKSVDGGDTFTQISNDERLSDGILKITDSGRVFIGNQHGLFEADKNGKILAVLLENEITDYTETVTRQIRGTDKTCKVLKCNMGVTGLDCVGNILYAQTWDGIYRIDTTKKDLEPVSITDGGNYPDIWGQMIEVSPTNPNRMIFMGRENYSASVSCWQNPAWMSEDGGKTWTKCKANNTSVFTKADWQGREKQFIIDPQNENRVLMFGSDTVLLSDDGGKNFTQANGVSNMMVGGKIHYNFYDPDLILYAAQDYTGTVSTDGGKTYRRLGINADGTSYGNFYGAFAADVNTYYGFASIAWGGPYHLVITHDGGVTWTDTGLLGDTVDSYVLSSMQAYSDFDTLFAGPYVSHDFGYTWSKMDGCEMVYTGNPIGQREMYGAMDGNVVVSYDAGRTWQPVCDRPLFESNKLIDIRITGIAFDQVNRYVYALCHWETWDNTGTGTWSDTFLYKVDVDAGNFEKLNFANDRTMGWSVARDVAVDPNCTQVVYVGISGGYFSCPSGFVRSIDGGENFTVLTNFNNGSFFYNRAENDGGHEVTALCVSPVDGKVVLGCGCYGFYTVDPPYDNTDLNNVTPKKHTVKYVYDNKLVATKQVTNSRPVEKVLYDEDGLTLVGWYDDAALTVPHDFKKGTFNSMCLYAKMKPAERVKFISGGKCIYECDIDDRKLMFSRIPEPKRKGYVFGGWFTDESLTTRADVYALTKSCSLYAGFYMDCADVFDADSSDFSDYIDYTDSMLHGISWATNDEITENRCVQMLLDKDAKYLLTFTMDTRFRLGQTASSFWPFNPITKWEGNDYYLDQDDVNGITPVGKPVYYEIDTSKNNRILLYYWSITSLTDFMTVKNSIHIYKLNGEPVL